MNVQQLDLVGRLILAGALGIAVLQIGLVWGLVRSVRRRPAIGPLAASPENAVEVLENEIDQLRGELYRMRKERDWLRKECARLARGQSEPEA